MNSQSVERRTRSSQRDSRREQILAVGLELFVRRGYVNTRVSDIAEAAGMSPGLLFHYFASKRDLYEELLRSGMERAYVAVFADGVTDPLAYFEDLATTVIGGMRTNRSMARMFVLVSRADADAILGQDTVAHATRDTLRRAAEVVREGQATGQIREGDPFALSTAFWGALQGVAQLVVSDEDAACPEPAWIVDLLKARQDVRRGGGS